MTIYQIYFRDSQRAGLDYLPYLNNNCTVFFENSVIKLLIDSGAHHESDYFGVVSYQLRSKLRHAADAWKDNDGIANTSTKIFTREAFEQELQRQRPDTMSFQRHPPHDPVTLADRFHPNFSHYFQRIMNAIGYHWTPTPFADVFYFNYFVAKADLYERYVKEMLSPALAVMAQMPELSGQLGSLPRLGAAALRGPHDRGATFLRRHRSRRRADRGLPEGRPPAARRDLE